MSKLKRSEWKIAPIGFEPASKLVKTYHYAKGHSKNFGLFGF